jgi:glycerol kinase
MTDASFILALDQGTTSSRALLFDRDLQVRAAAQQEFPSSIRARAGSSTIPKSSGSRSGP